MGPLLATLVLLARGEVKDGDAWVDPWKRLVQRGGLKDVKVRTREGMLDVVDSAIHACERFNIDKRRIYVQGIPPMLEFFQQCENDVEPDLEIVRRVVLENANDPPSIDGAAPKRPRDLRNR